MLELETTSSGPGHPSLLRNLKRQNSLHDWVHKPAYQRPMQETVIQNACFRLWAKISTIIRKRKEIQLRRSAWEIQRFTARPLWQEAGKNKRRREGDTWTCHNILRSTPWQRNHQNLAIAPQQKVAVGLHYTKSGLWHERTQSLSTNQFSALGLFWPTQNYSLSFTFAQLDFIYYILMHTFLLNTAVPAKFMDFTGSQPSVFNYHHLSYIWLRP